jgi:hypothetical protein
VLACVRCLQLCVRTQARVCMRREIQAGPMKRHHRHRQENSVCLLRDGGVEQELLRRLGRGDSELRGPGPAKLSGRVSRSRQRGVERGRRAGASGGIENLLLGVVDYEES